jgi:hypothetical protein
MIGNDTSPLLRRANEASARLDKAAANLANPFGLNQARREAETVVAELKKAVDTDRALAMFKAAQSQPKALFEERPGAAPSLTQSSNISSSPRGTHVPMTPSGGATVAPRDFPQIDELLRPPQRRRSLRRGAALRRGAGHIRPAGDRARASAFETAGPCRSSEELFRWRARRWRRRVRRCPTARCRSGA